MPALNETRNRIVSFAYLPTGWNFSKGVPAKEPVLKTALALLESLEKAGFHYTDAYPGNDGSAMLTAYALPDYYDFDVKPSGSITVVHARGDDELFCQEGMLVEEAQEKIKEFALQKWHTLDCLTSATITAENSDDLKVTLFKTPKTAQVSQSLTANAQNTPLVVFVNIVQNSTPQSSERRSSFGKFREKSFKTTGA